MVATLFSVLGLAALGLLGLVVFDVAARYRLTCMRSTASCAIVRERLGGDLAYRVAVSPNTRAIVETTRPRRGSPRVYLEFEADGKRTFLVEYQGTDARGRASAAAARLNAFLAGAGAPVLEETVGSPAVTWGLAGVVVILLAGIGWAYGRVRTHLGESAVSLPAA